MPRTKKAKGEVVPTEIVEETIIIEEINEGVSSPKESIWRRLSRWFFIGGLVLVPFFYIPGTAAIVFVIQETVIGMAVFLSCLFLLIDILKARSFDWKGRLSFVHYLVLVALVGIVASLFLSSSFGLSFWGNGDPQGTSVFIFVMALLGFFLASFLFRTYDTLVVLGKAMIVSFAGSFLLLLGANVWILFFKQPFFDVVAGGFNLLGSISSLSIFGGLGFLLALALLTFLETERVGRITLVLLGLLSLAILLLVGSGLVYIASIISLLILLGLWFVHGKEEGEGRLLGVNTILFFLIIFALLAISGYRIGGFLNLSPEVNPNFATSVSITSHVFSQNLQSLFLGTGPNTYFPDYVKFRPSAVNTTAFWNTDFPAGYSFWLTLLPTIGLVSSLALFVLLLGIMIASFRRLLIGESGKLIYRVQSCILLLASYLLLNSLVYGITLPIVVLLFVSTGVLFGMNRVEDGTDSPFYFRTASQTFISSLLATGSIVLILILGFFTAQRAIAFFEINKALVSVNQGGDATGAMDSIARSYKIFPHENTARIMSSLWFSHLAQVMSQNQPDPTNGQTALTNSLAYAEDSIRLDPLNHQNWALLGDVYRNVLSLDGALPRAIGAYEQARVLNPTNPLYPIFSGQLKLLTAQETTSTTDQATLLAAAEADFKHSIELKSDIPESHLLLGRLYAAQGKKDQAGQEFTATLTLDPKNQEASAELKVLESKK